MNPGGCVGGVASASASLRTYLYAGAAPPVPTMDNKGPDTQVHTVVTWSRAITEPESPRYFRGVKSS